METSDNPSGLEAHLGYWLRLVSNSVSSVFAEKLGVQGVSVAEWVAMRLIHGADVSASAIADEMGMTRGAISKIVDRLAGRGLVERSPLPGDGRARILKLTAKGARLLPVLAALADANDAEFFHGLPKADRAALMRILKDIATRKRLKTIPVD